jgi:Flp pilus assembly protein TadB
MDRIEPLWKLIEREPLVRWTAVATAALAWLSVAWFSPLPLLVAVLLIASVFVVRRKRGDHLSTAAPDDELDLL